MGIHPGMLVCRSDYPIPPEMREKLSLFCNVPAKFIIQNLDAESLYQVPLMLEREKFADKVCEALQLPIRVPELQDWEELVDRFQHPEREVTIALVGKYIQLPRRLSLRGRGPATRRHRPPRPRAHPLGTGGRPHRPGGGRGRRF